MKSVTYQTKAGITQYRPVLTPVLMRKLGTDADLPGFCLACGKTSHGFVEPDARKYECEYASCKQPKVYGIPELLLMGLVR